MSSNLAAIAEGTFAELVASGDVDIVSENEECHVIADDWTLLLVGDPLTAAIVAIEDESGEKEAALRAVIRDEELECIRGLDNRLNGVLSSLLRNSPDELARSLANILLN